MLRSLQFATSIASKPSTNHRSIVTTTSLSYRRHRSSLTAARGTGKIAFRHNAFSSSLAAAHSDTIRSNVRTVRESRDSDISSLSDSEILKMVAAGEIKTHVLEKAVKDVVRAARLRREVTRIAMKATAESDPFKDLPLSDLDAQRFFSQVHGSNCENVIGFVAIPIGVVGPLHLDGKSIFVPMATTEGALIASTNRGARAIALSGGCSSVVLRDGMTRAPVLSLPSVAIAAKVKFWVENPANLAVLQAAFATTSKFGKLLGVQAQLAGRTVHVRFRCFTGDAMGMNMASNGVNAAMKELIKVFPEVAVESLSGNFCTDKKSSAVNWIEGRGKSVAVETILRGDVIRDVLKTSVSDLTNLNVDKNLVGSALAGSIGGNNAHAANMVSAIFLATGQDPAQVIESANCMTLMEPTNGGEDLHVSVTMPSIEVGTVGGGTGLYPQGAALSILGVKGASSTTPGENACTLARIIAATVLAGEISLMSAHASGHLISAHLNLGRKGQKAAPEVRRAKLSFLDRPVTGTVEGRKYFSSESVAAAAMKELLECDDVPHCPVP